MNYFKERITAIGYALAGCRAAFVTEAHLKLEVVMAIAVLLLGWYCDLTKTEWFMIAGCITLVLCLELFNSALEKLCDLVYPQPHPTIKYVKDVAAGAVLLACVFSAIIGAIIFLF